MRALALSPAHRFTITAVRASRAHGRFNLNHFVQHGMRIVQLNQMLQHRLDPVPFLLVALQVRRNPNLPPLRYTYPTWDFSSRGVSTLS